MITRTTVMAATFGVLGALMLGIAASARAARSADPCSLLSEAQVGAALGAPVMRVNIGSDATHCHWQQQGSHGETIVDAGLMLEAAKTYDAAKPMMGMSGKVTQHRSQRRRRRCLLFGGRARHAPVCQEGGQALRIAVAGKGWSATEIKAKEQALAVALLGKL